MDQTGTMEQPLVETEAAVKGIRDLARIASVDVSTVSRALNHDPRVNPERARQIREIAERHGYRPRPLRSKRTQAIGVIIASLRPDNPDDPGENYLSRIAWIAQRVLGARRMHVNIECVRRFAEDVALPAVVQENRVDGVLVAGHPAVGLVRRIRETGIPVVAINDSSERIGISCVSSDPRPAMHAAILRLAAWGHRTFGLLMNELVYPTCIARVEAYRAALADLHIVADPSWLVSDLTIDIPGGREGIHALQQRGALPTAILCCNDWMALGAMMALQALGKRIPQDVSLMGHDNVFFCETLNPPLTSIRRYEQDLVTTGIQRLLEEIEQGPREPSDQRIEGTVVWRSSTGASPDRLSEAILPAKGMAKGMADIHA